jgi:hypothetical protein
VDKRVEGVDRLKREISKNSRELKGKLKVIKGGKSRRGLLKRRGLTCAFSLGRFKFPDKTNGVPNCS